MNVGVHHTFTQIGLSGAHSVASVLESNRVLEHLVLNTCDLGDEGMEPIANGEWNRGECSLTSQPYLSLFPVGG